MITCYYKKEYSKYTSNPNLSKLHQTCDGILYQDLYIECGQFQQTNLQLIIY